MQQRIDEQIGGIFVPPSTEEIASAAHLTPHEREQERLAVHSLDILRERIAKCGNDPEEIAKVRQLVARISEFVEGRHAFV